MLPIIPLVIGVGAVVAGAAVPAARASQRRQRLVQAKARARAVYRRLEFCVETIDPGADLTAADELSRASERWHTAGALLAEAVSEEQCAVAEDVAQEGLEHVAAACRKLGIDPPVISGA